MDIAEDHSSHLNAHLSSYISCHYQKKNSSSMMVKFLRLALPFAALLNAIVVSAVLLPIPSSLNGIASSTASTTTTVSVDSAPTTANSTMITTDMTTMTSTADSIASEATTSPMGSMQTARLLKSRQVHNADYAANKNNVAAPTTTNAAQDASDDSSSTAESTATSDSQSDSEEPSATNV